VQDLIQKYKQMAEFHRWLKKKQEKEEPIPETREELMQSYKIERPKFLMKKERPRSTKRRQSEWYIRKAYT